MAPGIDEGLEEVDGVAVDLVPVGGDASGHAPQDMGSQVGNGVGPGKDEKAGVVGDEVEMGPANRGGPADEAIAGPQVTRRGTERQAGDGGVAAAHEQFDMLAHRAGIAERVVGLDQAIEERFLRRPANVAELEGQQAPERTLEWIPGLVGQSRRPGMPGDIVGR